MLQTGLQDTLQILLVLIVEVTPSAQKRVDGRSQLRFLACCQLFWIDEELIRWNPQPADDLGECVEVGALVVADAGQQRRADPDLTSRLSPGDLFSFDTPFQGARQAIDVNNGVCHAAPVSVGRAISDGSSASRGCTHVAQPKRRARVGTTFCY